jgi:hypothetical protein
MITKQKFNQYEAVRQSGVTNMFDLKTVEALSGLTKEEIIEIMKNYPQLQEQFNS